MAESMALIVADNEKRVNELLTLIRMRPGKNALDLRDVGVRPQDGRLLRAMETMGLIAYKNAGWHLTAEGDIRVMETA